MKNQNDSRHCVELERVGRMLRANSVSLYLKEIDKIPLLNRDQEIAVSKKAARGDKKAKEVLIVSNLRFVVSVAKKYQGYGLPLSDLISEGNLGLIQAVDRFDYKRGFHFISYAIWWIKQSILKAISDKSRMVRLPMNRTHELMRIWEYIDEYSKEKGHRPSDREIAKHLGLDKGDVKKVLEMSQSHSSLEQIFSEEDGSQSYDTVSDSLFTDESESPDDIVLRNALRDNIRRILSKLPEREKKIIEYRFGLNGEEPQSLSSIGEKMNLTKERIRQIEQWAIGQIQNFGESRALYAYLS